MATNPFLFLLTELFQKLFYIHFHKGRSFESVFHMKRNRTIKNSLTGYAVIPEVGIEFGGLRWIEGMAMDSRDKDRAHISLITGSHSP